MTFVENAIELNTYSLKSFKYDQIIMYFNKDACTVNCYL